MGVFVGGNDSTLSLSDVDIAVCTNEKANSMVNRLLEENSLDTICMIIVDELHMVGDVGRGSVLEILLSKILLSKECIRILGMSATLSNMQDLKQWLSAEYFETNLRPIQLKLLVRINCFIKFVALK